MNVIELPYKAKEMIGTRKFQIDDRYICYKAAPHNSAMTSVWDGNKNITDTKLGLEIILACD